MQASLEQYKKLIAAHPCFSSLSDSDVHDFATLAQEKHYPVNTIIISQGEDVDAIYLILQGSVEVATEKITAENAIEYIPQAILNPGEAIGLSYTGLYSQIGVRTATLTTLSEVVLLRWSINVFLVFFQTRSAAWTSMQQSTQLMLRIQFIKQVAPFTTLATSKIAAIAKNVEELAVPSGTILFHQGEPGDRCYLIQSGRVAILIDDRDGMQRVAARLEPPALFGEIALLSETPRNATAKVIEDATLLTLSKDQLQILVEAHAQTAETITSLAMERTRPLRLPEIEAYHRDTTEGQITILKNRKRSRYYQLSPLGWFIWQQLDGTQTIQDIAIEILKKQRKFIPEAVITIIFDLIDSGFVSFPTPQLNVPSDDAPVKPKERVCNVTRCLRKARMIRFIFNHLDKKFTTSYNAGIRLLFTKVGQGFIAFISIIGLMVFGLLTSQTLPALATLNHPLLFLGLLLITYQLLVLFHELAHGYTVKALGREVHRAGIVFSWLGLFAFVDTSDMWLSTRGARIVVNLAGPYMDIVLAGIASVCAWFSPHAEVAAFLWLLALLLYWSVLSNLNPLRENDGYYALMNGLNHSKLRTNALRLLAQVQPQYIKLFFNFKFLREHSAEFMYWLICGIFLGVYIGLAILVQHYLVQHYLQNLQMMFTLPKEVWGVPIPIDSIPSHYFNWFLPTLVVVYFILRVWRLLKRER